MNRSRILDPRAVPVVAADVHLQAVPAARLHAAALRQRFAAPPAWQPEFTGDGRPFGGREPAQAAVLVPLVQRSAASGTDGLHVLLTRRTEHLRDHAGQISFPGGRCEPEDDGPAATALREAEEEVGLPPSHVEVIGQLPAYTTVTHFVVTPVVALVKAPYPSRLDSVEVDEAFEVPLAWLMNPAHHRRHLFRYEDDEREFLSMPWTARSAQGTGQEYFIWGATAAMLRNLYRFLSA